MSEPTTMNIATEPNNNGKRARTNAQPKPLKRTSALQDARFVASVTLASLPTTIKTMAEPLSDTFLKLRTELYNLEQNKSRLAKEDFRPISTRFNFNLNATSRVLEQAKDKFETLTDNSQITLEICKNELKKDICSLIDLEIEVIRADIEKHFCVSVGSLAIACAIATPIIEIHHSEALISSVFDQHHQTLLVYSETANVQTFFDTLKTATNYPGEAYQHNSLDGASVDAVSQVQDSFKDLIHTLFVRTWETYISRKDQDARDLVLREFVNLRMKQSATEPVAMDLDNITADSPALDALINSKVAERNSHLEKLVNKLSKQVNAKNPKKGAASATPNARAKQTGNPKGKGPKARAADKGTEGNKQTNGKKQKKKKKTNSNGKANLRS
jgi:hypothetical protein